MAIPACTKTLVALRPGKWPRKREEKKSEKEKRPQQERLILQGVPLPHFSHVGFRRSLTKAPSRNGLRPERGTKLLPVV